MSHVTSNRVLFVLSLAGVGVSGYLTLAHAHYLELVCGGSMHGCDIVAQHPSAHGFGIPAISGIPTAAFGLGMYVVMVALSFFRAVDPSIGTARRIGGVQWLIALASLGVAAWLTYLEAFVIHAWCVWCVSSATIIVLMFAAATLERIARPVPVEENTPS